MNKQETWQKAATGLVIDKEIYNFRTDHLHSESYKVLTEIHRVSQSPEGAIQDKKALPKEGREVIEKVSKIGKVGQKTLESDVKNITCSNRDFEKNMRVNLFFQKLIKQSEPGEEEEQNLMIEEPLMIDQAQVILLRCRLPKTTNFSLAITEGKERRLTPKERGPSSREL